MAKLNKKDRNILISLGYLEEDLPIIEDVMREVSIRLENTVTKDSKRISKEKARDLLKNDTDYFAGLGRSIFHWSTEKYLPNSKHYKLSFERRRN